MGQITDGSGSMVNIPSPGNFAAQISEMDGDEDGKALYSFGIKIGNNLRTSVTMITSVENNDSQEKTIEVGPVMSTMMMPPRELFDLEMFLSDALPKSDRLELKEEEDDVTMLRLVLLDTSSDQKIVFSHVIDS